MVSDSFQYGLRSKEKRALSFGNAERRGMFDICIESVWKAEKAGRTKLKRA